MAYNFVHIWKLAEESFGEVLYVTSDKLELCQLMPGARILGREPLM